MRAWILRKFSVLLAVIMVIGMVPVTAGGEEIGLPPSYFEEYELPVFDIVSPMALEFLEHEEIAPFSAGIANVCAFCVVENMGPGWNLGNTFDFTHIGHTSTCAGCIPNPHSPPGGADGTGIWACPVRNYAGMTLAAIETQWIGNRDANVTTQATIQNVYNAGFRTIRIPVTWYKATNGPPSWTIRQNFIDRVHQVVNWAYNAGTPDDRMTIIINTHHEELIFADWLVANIAGSEDFVERIWTQIARRFGDFGERLVFEGLNEPRVRAETSEWTGNAAQRDGVNRLNQAFVTAVRDTQNTHPNNRYRILMVPTLAASAAQGPLDDFRRPTDPTEGPRRIAMSVHAYVPNNFAGVGGGPIAHTWAEGDVTSMMNRVLARANAADIDMPVVFGEWGVVSRSAAANETRRAEYATFYAQEAARRRAAHVWWDNGATRTDNHDAIEGNFGLFRRRSEHWTDMPPHLTPGSPNVPHMGLVFPTIPPAIRAGHEAGVRLRTGATRCQCIAIVSPSTLNAQEGVATELPLAASRADAVFTAGTPAPPAGVTITGGYLRVAATVAPGEHSFQIVATSGSLVATQTFILTVFGEGDAPPGRNYRNLNMTPGATHTEMRFTWHSGRATGVSLRIWPQGNRGDYRTVLTTVVDDYIVNRPGGEGGIAQYHVHQLYVSDLTPNTIYQYTLVWPGGESTPKSFRTGGGSSFQFLVAGDPQIGTGGVDYDRTDWINALTNSARMFPHSQFILSMGDQVATALPQEMVPGPTNTPVPGPMGDPQNPTPLELRGAQRRFDGLLTPTQMQSLPFVPVVGNHDAPNHAGTNVNPHLWHRHYNLPNIRRHGVAPASGTGGGGPPTDIDFYFRYGDVLFIQIDSNSPTIDSARRTWFEGVVSRNEDALWRVVLLHHSPYSVHRALNYPTKGHIIRDWVPRFEAAGIDIVFGGHEHVYSRSHHMLGSGAPQPNQSWVNPDGVVRQGAHGALYHAVLNPTGITYLTFGSPTRSNVRYETAMATRTNILRHHSVFNIPTALADIGPFDDNHRHMSTVTVTPTTFSVATYELDNAAAGAQNRFRMVDLYTIVRNPGSDVVPADAEIPIFDTTWKEVPDPYVDIPFNWEPNRRPPDANVTHGATNHVLALAGLDITPCIIDSDDNIIVRFTYAEGRTAGSNRRFLAWTDLSGPEAGRNSLAFLTTANLSTNRVAISDRVEATDTTAEILIPRDILASGPNTATRLYVAMGIDAGPIGHSSPTEEEPDPPPNRYTEPGVNRGHTEFPWLQSIQLIARAASGVGNPMPCLSCNNLPCRCVPMASVEFRLNGGERVGGGELVQAVPLGIGGAEAPQVSRPGFVHTWDAPFYSVTTNIIVNAVWTPLGMPITILYDLSTTDRVGEGFTTFTGGSGWPDALRPAFAPLGRTGGSTSVYSAIEPARAILASGRDGVSQVVWLNIGGPGGIGGTGATAIPVSPEMRYRIEYTAYFPVACTPLIRVEGAADLFGYIPGGTVGGSHVLVSGSPVAANEVFTHSLTLTGEQIAALGARNISLSASANPTNIHYLNIRVIEHSDAELPPMVTVTFDANGGTGNMAPLEVLQGTSINAPASTFTNGAYTFAGWNTAADGTGTAFAVGAPVPVTADMTLFARWTLDEVTHTITFNANGGEGPDWTLEVPDGESFDVPERSFDHHYDFLGWNTAADGSGDAFEPGDTVIPTANMTLFAQWDSEMVMHTISFNANGGAGEMLAAQVTADAAFPIPANTFTRDDFAFLGWSTTADGAVEFLPGATIPEVSANMTLFAQWQPGSVVWRTVSFDPNGGIGEMQPQDVSDGEAFTIPPNAFTRENHTFAGWNTAANGLGTSFEPGATIESVTENMTLFAQWTEVAGDTHTVSFDANNGTGTMPPQVVAAGTSLVIPANIFERIGYTFAGWNTAANGFGTSFEPGATIEAVTADMTLFAQWTAISAVTHTITFNANNGTGDMPPQQVADGDSFTIPANIFDRTGFNFASWNTAADGSGDFFPPAATIPSVTGNMTLFAQWATAGDVLPQITSPATFPGIRDSEDINIQLQASGNPTWTVAPGSELPYGVTLTGGGRLEGTPFFAGSHTFTVQARNALGYDSQIVTLSVTPRANDISEFPTNTAVLTTSHEFARVDEEVTITHRLDNNHGFTAMLIRVNIPDGLTLVSYDSHPALRPQLQVQHPYANWPGPAPGDTGRYIVFGWIGHTENVTINGPILATTFSVDSGTFGRNLRITTEFNTTTQRAAELGSQQLPTRAPGDVEWGTPQFPFEIVPGGVTVRPQTVAGNTVRKGILVGDVNNDGRVTSEDATLLARWIAGQNVRIDREAAQIHRDRPNVQSLTQDLVLLARWLVGQNVMSDITG